MGGGWGQDDNSPLHADFFLSACIVQLFSPLQKAQMFAHSWPYFPDVVCIVRHLAGGAGQGVD